MCKEHLTEPGCEPEPSDLAHLCSCQLSCPALSTDLASGDCIWPSIGRTITAVSLRELLCVLWRRSIHRLRTPQ